MTSPKSNEAQTERKQERKTYLRKINGLRGGKKRWKQVVDVEYSAFLYSSFHLSFFKTFLVSSTQSNHLIALNKHHKTAKQMAM